MNPQQHERDLLRGRRADGPLAWLRGRRNREDSGRYLDSREWRWSSLAGRGGEVCLAPIRRCGAAARSPNAGGGFRTATEATWPERECICASRSVP